VNHLFCYERTEWKQRLRIDANENQETVVYIAVPVETIRDGVNRLEEVSTGI
jgi:hypothetical protein